MKLPQQAPINKSTAHPDPAEQAEIVQLQAVAAHDRNAFDALYRSYYPRLNDFLARLVGNYPGLAEEVLNDTMYVVWTRADTFAGRSRVSTWIIRYCLQASLEAPRA